MVSLFQTFVKWLLWCFLDVLLLLLSSFVPLLDYWPGSPLSGLDLFVWSDYRLVPALQLR